MKYIVIVFDGFREHAYKSIVASSACEACHLARINYETSHGRLLDVSEGHSVEAFKMSTSGVIN